MSGVELFEQREQSVIAQAIKKYLGVEPTRDSFAQVNRVAKTTSSGKQYTLLYGNQSLGIIKYDISKENCNIVFEPNIECDEGELLRI